MIYVVFNVNGDIIGVADSPDEATRIYCKKYEDVDWPSDFKGGLFNYLVSIGRIQEFEINIFYYQ